jgi:hypothetical protein
MTGNDRLIMLRKIPGPDLKSEASILLGNLKITLRITGQSISGARFKPGISRIRA